MDPEDVSLDEAMGMAHWALTEAQNVLHRERGGNVDERRCMVLWASMLKERTTAERVKVEARQQHLDVREELLNRLQTVINSHDRDSQRMLAEAKELHASVEP
jgi:tryptophanyl-tRNA synthetase